jgi:hypothetical protein
MLWGHNDTLLGIQMATFAEISERPKAKLLPPLDRPLVGALRARTKEQSSWRKDGFIILRGFMPEELLDPYIERRAQLNEPGGWLSPTSYLHVPELRDVALYPPLLTIMKSLITEEMMLHLSLTGWISTERDWRQDDYLNPPFVNSWYSAVWFALDKIDGDCGPFEFVPGSHKWPLLRREKIWTLMTKEELEAVDPINGNKIWEKRAERLMTPAIEDEIRRRGATPRTFLAEKGDVLIWHGRLLHRGSLARTRFTARKSLITHYSGIGHREDMTGRAQHRGGGWYATFDHPLY